jgi:hypothetical protein
MAYEELLGNMGEEAVKKSTLTTRQIIPLRNFAFKLLEGRSFRVGIHF